MKYLHHQSQLAYKVIFIEKIPGEVHPSPARDRSSPDHTRPPDGVGTWSARLRHSSGEKQQACRRQWGWQGGTSPVIGDVGISHKKTF